ncbi:MAG: hypothetical protein R3195_16700 [Gemmatimonadota bacterium]|nr:hypothetical protein [Gemmatimonadota bacterium]
MRYSEWLSMRTTAAIGVMLLAMPSCATSLRAQTPECPDYDPADGIVWGMVRAAEGGAPVGGAEILVRWADGETRAQSLRNGLYIVCGVRPGVPVIVQAALENFDGAGVPAQLEEAEILELPLHVSFSDGGSAAITGRVVGRVIDRQTLQPVSNALVGAGDSGYTGVTDGYGRFQLDQVPPGFQSINVRHLAYGETQARFDMPPDGTLEVEVRVNPTAIEVAPLEVQVLGVRSIRLERSGFYERKDWNDRIGLGSYVTRLDLQQRGASQLSHALAEIPRLSFQRSSGCYGSRCAFPVFSGSGANCSQLRREGGEFLIGASIYLNGVRQRMATGGAVMGIDDLVKPSDVAGVEVYTGSGDLPGEFADMNAQRCGAIVIWTGR